MLTNLSNAIENGALDVSELLFNYHFYEYDQESREWQNYHINKILIDDVLTKGIENNTQSSIYLKMLKEDIEQTKYYAYPVHSHPLMYDILKQLELYSSNLIFTLDGDMRLDVGQVITVYELGPNNSKMEQFSGQWVISKIRHSFRDKMYKCHIIGSRRFYSKK